MYEIAICDDCEADRKVLRQRIEKNQLYDEKYKIYEYTSGEDLVGALECISFSLIFLDVQMEGIDGDETACRIRKINNNLILVFYTGYADPSPRRIEVQPYRYIMKNMSPSTMDEYISASLIKMREVMKIPSIAVKAGQTLLFIKADQIVYAEKDKKSTRIYLSQQALDAYGISKDKDGKYPVIRSKERLEDIYMELKNYDFGYPHDSYIINFNYLNSCRSNAMTLEDVDISFPIARSKAKDFNKAKMEFVRSKYVGARENDN